MKICVVGGTGNISSGIVNVLLEHNHEVVCFNRGIRGRLPDGVRLIKGDRLNSKDFEDKIKSENFDAAIDMLCFNAQQAKSSIRAFKNVKHFVMCSTVGTYGNKYNLFPTDENHPIHPADGYSHNKAEADSVFMDAYEKNNFPVTIIKSSTVYGPKGGLIRQVASVDFSWIDRVRKGKPIIVCADGNAIHQFIYADDAGLAFSGVLGKKHCIGQNYILANKGFITWNEYHHTAMKVIGREVELVGVPLANLEKMKVPGLDLCKNYFSHHTYYSADKLIRDVPEFKPKVSLESGMRKVIKEMDKNGKIPNSDEKNWEDQIIKNQRKVKITISNKIAKLLFKIKRKIKR